jgi:simple sugar transport system substrate-binding protein
MTKKKLMCIALGLAFAAGVGAAAAQGRQTIVTVVKDTGESWFTRMAEGVKAFGEQNPGVATSEVGPGKADAAQQLQLVEDTVAKKIDAIAVVPMDPAALEGVLRRAMQRGITVVTHEASTAKNTQADVEAFDNAAFGAHMNDRLAACMGQKGKWTSFVGSLGSLTHVQWADGGAANAQKKYPGMTLVDAKNESFNDANTAYNKAKELLRKYPDIKGFQGGSAVDVLGIGRAVEEAGLVGKVCVVGLGLPRDSGKYLESGAVQGISFWDPKDAGLVMNTVAKLLLDKKPITDGMSLGVKGYEKVHVAKGPGKGVLITGNAWIDVDKSNYKNYPF